MSSVVNCLEVAGALTITCYDVKEVAQHRLHGECCQKQETSDEFFPPSGGKEESAHIQCGLSVGRDVDSSPWDGSDCASLKATTLYEK